MLTFSRSGYVTGSTINYKPCEAIQRNGPMDVIQGIIVHQTYSKSAAATINGYNVPDANGAHFLIDRDGTIDQTASILRITKHVGYIKSKCYDTHSCTPAKSKDIAGFRRLPDLKEAARLESKYEIKTTAPMDRYPSNHNSIGIELVGMAYDVAGAKEKVYERASEAQNNSLRWLVRELEDTLKIAHDRVYRHPQVSRKNASEAESANWR